MPVLNCNYKDHFHVLSGGQDTCLNKAFDAPNVLVSPTPRGTIGESIQFTENTSKAGEDTDLEDHHLCQGVEHPHPGSSTGISKAYCQRCATGGN